MGGGGSNNAQQQADAAERERQAQIAASTASINKVYDDPSRAATYDKLATDTTQFYQSDLDRQKAQNDRSLKFALARSGNNGGSLQVDQSQKLGEDYLKGVVEASRRGQAAGASLKAADESSRMQLLAMAQSGLDATTGGARAASSLQSNLQAGQADATANQLGDLFGDLSDVYRKSEDAAALRRGEKYSYDTTYKPLFGAGYRG